MKNRLLTTAAALIGAALLPSAHAGPISYTTGDIILGFEESSGPTSGEDLLIDIGQYSNLGSFTSLDLTTDLNAAFGTGIWSPTSIDYGAYGVIVPGVAWSTIYETSAGSLNPVSSGQGYPKTDYQAITSTTYAGGYQYLAAHGGATGGYGVEVSGGTAGAWSQYNPASAAFSVNGNDAETALGNTLDLYTESTTGSAQYTVVQTPYQITVNDAGTLSITAVPEPSTYALFGLGALALVIAYRRKAKS